MIGADRDTPERTVQPRPEEPSPIEGDLLARAEGSEVRCAGALLAGGASRRMGNPKAELELGGLSLGRRAAATLLSLTPRVVQAGGAPIVGLDIPLLRDQRRGAGPGAGIEAALACFDLPVAVLAVDLPFVPPELLEHALRHVERGADVCAPHWRGRWQPLCAVYAPAALPRLTTRLDRNRPGLQGLLEQIGTALPDDILLSLGDPDKLLRNINTPEDFDNAQRLI